MASGTGWVGGPRWHKVRRHAGGTANSHPMGRRRTNAYAVMMRALGGGKRGNKGKRRKER